MIKKLSLFPGPKASVLLKQIFYNVQIIFNNSNSVIIETLTIVLGFKDYLPALQVMQPAGKLN